MSDLEVKEDKQESGGGGDSLYALVILFQEYRKNSCFALPLASRVGLLRWARWKKGKSGD